MRRRRTAHPHGNSKPFHVVLLGKDGVGKSALTVRFLTRRFIGEYDKTIESTYRHVLQIDNDEVFVDIMDTAGENTDVKLRRSTRRGDLFIVLYSIVDRSSFDEARGIARYIKDHRNVESISMVIVATKKDLDHLRRVDIEEGIGFSNELDCTFYEVSISEGYTEVQELLNELIKRVLTHRSEKKDTLRIPSLGLKRSPSIERRKRTTSFEKTQKLNSDKHDADGKDYGSKSPDIGRKKDYGNHVPDGQLKPSKSLRDLVTGLSTVEETGSKSRFMSKGNSPVSQRKKNPFSVEKVKGAPNASKLKLPKIEDEQKSPSKPKTMFTLQKVKTGHSGPSAAGLRKSPSQKSLNTSNDHPVDNNENNNDGSKDMVDEQDQDKPKGPFLLNKFHSTSSEKLQPSSTHERMRATTSFGRMKVGFERTFGRKKAIYL